MRKSIGLELSKTATLPTKFGLFTVQAFKVRESNEEHLAIKKGEILHADRLMTRVHSECLTGDGLGSLKCDCGDQLASSLRMIEEAGTGLVLYLRQEGRGIGLINKIDAYYLQDGGSNTIEANTLLGLDVDARKYDIAAEYLKLYKVQSIDLISNNPEKKSQLESFGIRVGELIPLRIPPNPFNEKYLKVKKDQMNHNL